MQAWYVHLSLVVYLSSERRAACCCRQLRLPPQLLLLQKRRQLSGPVPQPNLTPVLAAAAPGTGLQDTWITSHSSNSSGSNGSSVVPPISQTMVAVLTDGSGWLYHPDMGLWLLIKGPAAAAAAPGQPGFTGLAATVSTIAAGIARTGDAEKLRAATAAAAAAAAVQVPLSRVLLPPAGPELSVWQRREAWLQLSAAELLGDAAGYQTWLGLLVGLLARERDVVSVICIGPGYLPAWQMWMEKSPPLHTVLVVARMFPVHIR